MATQLLRQPADAREQPSYSFMSLVKKTGTLTKSSRSKHIDPLTQAKNKIIDALKVQTAFVAIVAEGKPLPKNEAGREASTWFSKQNDGWACTGGSTGTPRAPLRQPRYGHSAARGSPLWTTGTSRHTEGSILDADRGSIFNAD